MNIQAGFSKADLMEILPETKSCEMPLSAQGFYLSKSEELSPFNEYVAFTTSVVLSYSRVL